MILLRCIRIQHEGHETPALIPSDQPSWEALKKKKVGSTVATETKRARSPEQHRLFFAAIHKAFDNQQTEFPNEEQLRKALLIHCGYVEQQMKLTGEIVLIAKSIAFHNMPHEEFTTLFDDVLNAICEIVIPGVTPEEFIAEIKS